MTEKRCSKCKQWFPATTEYFHRHKSDKLYPRCKTCKNDYGRTEKGKDVRRRKIAKRKRIHPEVMSARLAVAHAVSEGKLPRPETRACFFCSEDAIEYHHPSYEKKHYLTVIPVCKKCHTDWHYRKSKEAV